MKNILFVLAILISALRLPAQTNAPVRLALVAESAEASTAADVLTVQLSSHKNLQLLERNEIEKVYREQGLSAGNKDYLKLGQILGADGLLLLEVVRTKQATNLMARLIAVKPGVILTDGSFAWPLKDTAQWAESVSTYLNLFLPKLSVPAKDAIPISMVNLRSAVASTEGAEAERQLKLLTIQRLSREKELFVLERQRMQLLSEEKALKTDDSAFWNGSYLLEGVVDQNGYSKGTITVDARLTPPKGGKLLLFEVSGSRTNFSEVVNQLTAKVIELLKVNSSVPEWKSTDEAAQYFEEAKWALRWGVYSEAEAAADSAWALGKNDLSCALLRVSAYVSDVSSKTSRFQEGTMSFGLGTERLENSSMKEIADAHLAAVFEQKGSSIRYVTLDEISDSQTISHAIYSLELFYNFSQTSPEGVSKLLWSGAGYTDWHNSDWYQLGIDDLVAASRVLQNFNFVPEAQKPVADKLAELRALARSVAELISKSSTVHDSYFVGDRAATHDELGNTIGGIPSIFRCKVNWGCYWQETPEDTFALYHELMSSPVFCYLHEDLWFRPLEQPRLVAWNENDRKRLTTVWNDFIRETDASTNMFMRMEGKAMELRDAGNEKEASIAATNFFEALSENRCAFVTNNVEVLYMNWGIDDLVGAIGGYKAEGSGATMRSDAPEWEALRKQCSEYLTKVGAKDAECQKSLADQQNMLAFEKQKQYLKNNTPFDPQEFVQLFIFGFKDYSKTQALEIQPLLAAYKINLTGTWAQIGVMQVGRVEDGVKRILNPPALQPTATPTVKPPQPVTVAKAIVVAPTVTNVPEVVTNVLVANKSFSIPVEKLVDLDSSESMGDDSKVTVNAHHWLEGKLLLDFQYDLSIDIFKDNTLWSMREVSGSAIALFDPAAESWNVIACSQVDIQSQNNYYDRTVLFHGDLFTCDGGEIRKYDLVSQQWQTLKISDGNNYQLFAVNGHLYAANGSVIFEITDGGTATQILASARRRPPVSVLDALDFGTPVLFEGPNHSLRVSTGSKILTWMTNDWHEDSITPPASFPAEILTGGILFRHTADGMSQPISLSFLPAETNASELYLFQKMPVPKGVISMSSPVAALPSPKPLWNMPSTLFLANLPATVHRSDLYLLVDHSQGQDVRSKQPRHLLIGKTFLPKDGYHAALLCYSKDLPLAQKLFLKFDAPDSCQPLTGSDPSAIQWFPNMPPAWMFFSDDFLFFGLEIPRNSSPVGMPHRSDVGGNASVWLMPISQIAATRTAQKQIQLEQKAQAVAATKQAQQAFLAKYDLNHNGVIDPDEREAALDDPAFIESELNTIDANHNDRLDMEELAYFDANKNKILEPKEQSGIEIAQHLLAERLLKKFDANGDGVLDRPEFNALVQSSPEANARPMPGLTSQFPDDNHDGKIDLAELETFLKQQMRGGLRSRRMPGAMPFNQMRLDPNQPVDPRQMFKTAVEFYWQNPPSATNRPPFNNRIPSGAGLVPNGMQKDTKP